MESTPKVSVCMITYNHEAFIRQAVESALMQKTTFEYEIVVGEDCSTDKTRETICEIAGKYPEKIVTNLQKVNVGGAENFLSTFAMCKGEYIAILEGDDYWTDPNKLQKQVEFLESNPDYGMVHTAFRKIFSNSTKPPIYCTGPRPSGNVFIPLLLNNFIGTLTILVRKDLALKAVERRGNLQVRGATIVGDYPLWLSIALESKIGYLDMDTAVYRILDGSFTHPKSLRKYLLFQQEGFDIINAFAVFLPDNDRQRVVRQMKTEFQTTVFKAILEDTSIINEYKTLLDDFIPGRPSVRLLYCVVVFCRYNRMVIRTISFLLRLSGVKKLME